MLRHTQGSRLKAWVGGPSFTPEANALFARFTTPPTPARKILINNLIVSLIAAGIWTKLDALYLTAAADGQAARQNWLQDLYNLTAVGGPTFAADRGYTGDGSTSYLTTGFVPSTAGGKYVLDSSHLSAWSRTDSVNNSILIGARTSATVAGAQISPRTTSTSNSYTANQGALHNFVAAISTSAHFLARRSASAAIALIYNGASIDAGTDVSTTLPAYQFALGGVNQAGTVIGLSNRQIAQASIGASLSDAEALAFYNAINTYLQAVGAA